jgi:hypothetical protein
MAEVKVTRHSEQLNRCLSRCLHGLRANQPISTVPQPKSPRLPFPSVHLHIYETPGICTPCSRGLAFRVLQIWVEFRVVDEVDSSFHIETFEQHG